MNQAATAMTLDKDIQTVIQMIQILRRLQKDTTPSSSPSQGNNEDVYEGFE